MSSLPPSNLSPSERRVWLLNSATPAAASEEALEALVLGLIGGRPGMARLRFLPGTLSQVQMLPDRAVVRHLNPGIDL